MSSYADLYARLGAYQAEAARRQGDIWSNFAVNVGQIPLQIQQQALLKAREQRLNQQAASEQQLTDLKLRGEQRAQQEQADVDWVWSQPIWNDETGDFDVQKATKVAQEAGFGHYVPKIIEQGGKWNEEAAKTREAHAKLLDQSRESLGNSAVGLDVTNDGDWQAYNAVAARNQWITRDEANRNISMPPEARGSVKARYIQQSKGASERTAPIKAEPGTTFLNRETMQPIATVPPKPGEAEMD